MSEAPEAAPCGFYGKVPMLGDFVARRLPASFLNPWDAWLQEAVGWSRERLGERWRDYYLTCPIWRFAMGEGLCGPEAWTGVLMPSVDRVGRYFPLTLARPLPGSASLLGILEDPWFERAEAIALSVLERETVDLESFDHDVSGLGALTARLRGRGGHAPTMQDGPYGLRLQAGESADFGVLVPVIGHELLARQIGSYSLWWSAGSEAVVPELLICSGMPVPGVYTDMMGADGGYGEWRDRPVTGAGT